MFIWTFHGIVDAIFIVLLLIGGLVFLILMGIEKLKRKFSKKKTKTVKRV